MLTAWRSTARLTLLAAGILVASTAANAQPASKTESGALNVVTTIRPLHSLTAAVMDGVGTPRLLVDGSASPHTFALKPSDAKALAAAKVLLRISPGLEPFTVKLLQSLPKTVRVVTLQDAPGLTLHKLRTGDTFETHGHDGHKGHGHKEHGHKSDHGKEDLDGHIWLDPDNARIMARFIAETLATAAPEHAARFRANAEALSARLDALAKELAETVKPAAGKSYIVFHDAYQYFERRYGIAPAGSVTISPDVPASARRISALRKKVAELKAACIFAEPQFAPRLIDPIIEGTKVRRGVLDPLGVAIPAGPEQYFALMRALAGDLRSCLSDPT